MIFKRNVAKNYQSHLLIQPIHFFKVVTISKVYDSSYDPAGRSVLWEADAHEYLSHATFLAGEIQ
jgi:hypothetical protein